MVELQRDADVELERIAPSVDDLDASSRTPATAGAGRRPVRDAMLGRPHTDLDFATSARPDDTERAARGRRRRDLGHGRDFGTIGCRKEEWTVEVTTSAPRRTTRRRRSRPSTSATPWRRPRPARLHHRRDGGPAPAGWSRTRTAESIDLACGSCSGTGAPRTPLRRPAADDAAARFAASSASSSHPRWSRDDGMAERIEIISAERVGRAREADLGVVPRRGLALLVETGPRRASCRSCPRFALERDEHQPGTRTSTAHADLARAVDQLEDCCPAPAGASCHGSLPLIHNQGKPRTRKLLDDGSVTFDHHDVVGAIHRSGMQALRSSRTRTTRSPSWSKPHLRSTATARGSCTPPSPLGARRGRPAERLTS